MESRKEIFDILQNEYVYSCGELSITALFDWGNEGEVSKSNSFSICRNFKDDETERTIKYPIRLYDNIDNALNDFIELCEKEIGENDE